MLRHRSGLVIKIQLPTFFLVAATFSYAEAQSIAETCAPNSQTYTSCQQVLGFPLETTRFGQEGLRIASASTKSAQLDKIVSQYTTPQARENQQDYFNEIVKLLELSPSGRKSLECFRMQDPLISRIGVNFTAPQALFEGMIGSVDEEADPAQPGKSIVNLRFDLRNQSPLQAISIVAHEMMHICDSPERLRNTQERVRLRHELGDHNSNMFQPLIQQLSEAPNFVEMLTALGEYTENTGVPDERLSVLPEGIAREAKQFREKVLRLNQLEVTHDQNGILSELKAYSEANVNLFKELIELKPREFCNERTSSNFIPGETTFGTNRALIEQELLDGSFVHRLIDVYSNNGYAASSFYRTVNPNPPVHVMGYGETYHIEPSPTLTFQQDSSGQRILTPSFVTRYNELMPGLDPRYRLSL